jgi:hypothetical protein
VAFAFGFFSQKEFLEFSNITTPQERHSESAAKVSKASVAIHHPPR